MTACNILRHVATMLALALATGCAGALHPAATDPLPVSREAIEGHWRFLASDALEGRMTGTRGYDAAAEYVASQFRSMGLAPAGTDGYFQPVPFAVAQIDAERSRVRLHRRGRAHTLKWKQDWIAGADVLREHTQVRAGAVFVGYGVQAPDLGHDDYAGLDVRGKIVVHVLGAPKSFPANPRAYYSSPAVKEALAAAQGAIGTVTLRDAHSAQKYKWELVSNNAGRVASMKWVGADGKAADYFPELRGSMVLSETAAAALFQGAPKSHADVLAANAAGAPLTGFALPGEIEIDKRGTVSRQSSPNVVALLRGSDPALAAEHVVYTAHLDHLGTGAPVNGDAIYNGAWDNAMGVAMMLETARALAAVPRRRSLLFIATVAEERFLQGSDYFAHYPTVPAAQLVANINLDNPLLLFPLAEVVAYGGEHSTIGAAVEAAARAEGLRQAPDPLPDEVVFIRSDQFSFARAGVPGVFLKPGFASADPAIDGGKRIEDHQRAHYHQPSDDLSRSVDWDAVVRFTRVNARTGEILANADARPRWHPGNFFGDKFGKGRAP
jgi:Zn-dependent M28 family amino/carboxypeptidase